MRPHQYLAIAIRLFAVVLLLSTLRQSELLIQVIINGDYQGMDVSITSLAFALVIPLMVSIIMWLFPLSISKEIITPEYDQEVTKLNNLDLLSTLVAAVGLCFTFFALVDAIYWFVYWLLVNSPDGTYYNDGALPQDAKANMWATAFELLLGFFFIVKCQWLSKTITKVAR